MKKMNLLRAAVLPAAAVAAVGLGAPSAFAASTYTVTAGSAADGTSVDWTASTDSVTFVDTTDSITMTCAGSTATGTVDVGSGESGTDIAPINGISWSGCQGLGVDLTVTANNTPWSLNATGATSSGQTDGNISDISATVTDTSTGGSLCKFSVTGTVPGTYDNSGPALTVDGGGLTISDVSGLVCGAGVISDSADATYSAVYDVSADNADFNPIAVTSE